MLKQRCILLKLSIMSRCFRSRMLILATAAIGISSLSFGQLDTHQHKNVANWKLANQYTSASLSPYLYSSNLSPGWINKTNRFWYSWSDSTGTKYWLVDSKAKKKEPLFDSAKMAALITEANFKPIDSTTLRISTVTFDEKDELIMRFVCDNMRYEYNRKSGALKKLGEVRSNQSDNTGRRGGGGAQSGNANAFKNESPDKKGYVYAKDHNLFYVEYLDEKREKESDPIQLTTDGADNYSFGARQGTGSEDDGEQTQGQQSGDKEGRVRARVTWSKDSNRFYVTRGDSRKVKDLWLVNSLSEPRPTLLTYKYSMPGDADVSQVEVFAFDREAKKLEKLPVERYKDQRIFDIHFQDTTSDSLRFVRRDRLQRNLELIELDLKSKSMKVLLTEKTENAFLETQNVRYVKPGGDFVWFSERSGWGHYYLYGNDGKLKNAITSGPWRASSIAELDEKSEMIWVGGQGREEGENPYFNHLYRVKLDGNNLQLLNPGSADHRASLSDDKQFIVNTASRIDLPSKISLLDKDGNEVMPLEEMDISRLVAAGWKMPEPFVVKAADGVNDIYGNMWKPGDFDAKKSYPIIAYVYPGPQTESVSSTFTTSTSLQQLAQLGFIVIQIGNRGGNPARSNAYHSFGYFNLRDYGLADKKAGIEELGRRYPWIDTDRVGIYGHSGGGFMTGAALLLPPFNEFFKVGVSSAGNHDNNVYNQNWSEQHHGLKEVPLESTGTSTANRGRTAGSDPIVSDLEDAFLLMQADSAAQDGKSDTKTRFDIKVPANHELAANLKGHLLIVHGDMDNNVHPAGSVRLVNALIKANKRFDFMIMPGQAHGFGPYTGYFNQMTMEYFAEHLLGDYYRGRADFSDKGGN